jgi:rRNA maturation protein Nop10
MITRDDLPETPDWQLPLRKCCGEHTVELTCSVCGQWTRIPAPATN